MPASPGARRRSRTAAAARKVEGYAARASTKVARVGREPMNDVDRTLLLVIVALAGVSALSWGTIGWALRVTTRSANRFFLANLMIGLGAVLVTGRGAEPSFVAYPLADWLVLGGIALFRGGILFTVPCERPSAARRLAPLAVAIAATAFASPTPASFTLRAVVFSLVAAWLCVGCWQACRQGLAGEQFPALARLSIGWPFLAAGTLMGLRALDVVIGTLRGTRFVPENEGSLGPFMWMMIMLLIAANIAMVGLSVGRLVMRIRELAERDPLTGCLNRRAFEARMAAELERCQRSGDPVACITFDLDHFKRVNDEHGHDAGDAALVHAVEVARAQTRPFDALGRYGGEEFVVLMPGANEDGARDAARRIRAALADRPLDYAGTSLPIRASFGVAVRAPGETMPSMLRRADAAMYEAKRLGRDRIETAEGPGATAMPRAA